MSRRLSWCITPCPHEDVCAAHFSHKGGGEVEITFYGRPKITPLKNGRYRFECDDYIPLKKEGK